MTALLWYWEQYAGEGLGRGFDLWGWGAVEWFEARVPGPTYLVALQMDLLQKQASNYVVQEW